MKPRHTGMASSNVFRPGFGTCTDDESKQSQTSASGVMEATCVDRKPCTRLASSGSANLTADSCKSSTQVKIQRLPSSTLSNVSLFLTASHLRELPWLLPFDHRSDCASNDRSPLELNTVMGRGTLACGHLHGIKAAT